MAVLLELKDITLSYSGRTLLDGVSATFHDDRKVAFIGVNGAGKSTLCRLINETEHAEGGSITRHKALRLGYLRQDDPFEDGETALSFLMRDSGKADWQCGEMAGRFNIGADLLEGRVKAMSGGWQTRLKLAALLLHEPNFLILDEPTNFLDLRTQLLLQKFMKSWRAGCLIVSHDRAFLNHTCNHTMELSAAKLYEYPGRVKDYLEHRELRIEQQLRENDAREGKIKQLQRFIDKNRAGANTASQARSKQKQLDKIENELHDIEQIKRNVKLRLPEPTPIRTTVLECENLSIGYGENVISGKINFSIEPGARLAITGDNGQGKTTLLRTLTDSLPIISGKFKWAANCQLLVYAQHVFSSLPEALTVREHLVNIAPKSIMEKEVLDVAGGFRFSGNDVQKKISVLSGGERARLCLAGLFLHGGNVLILDEPVNHLDVETVEALADALCNYKGTVILVSHDRNFSCRVATEVIELKDSRARRFPGTFADYLHKLENETGAEAGDDTEAAAVKKDDSKRRYLIEKRISNLESQIEKLDNQIEPLKVKITECHNWEDGAKIQAQIDPLESKKNECESEWLELQTELEELSV